MVFPASARRTAWRMPLVALACFAVLASWTARPVTAQPLEGRLRQVHALWEKGRFAELVPVLQKMGTSPLLEDVRLYLLAESLRQANRESEALTAYRKLLASFPGSWMSRAGTFPYLLLAARVEGPAALDRLMPLIADLPTPYQRGRATEALADLHPSASQIRGRQLLNALRAYRSGSQFYQDVAESQAVLKKLLAESYGFRFGRDEWLEILLRACREGLGPIAERAAAGIAAGLGADGPAVTMLVQAESLRLRKQVPAALAVLDRLLATPSLDRGLAGLAHQLKGDVLHFADRHAPAIAEFHLALAHGKSPVDVVAARYRLMRSAAAAGFDQEALREAEVLCREARGIPLLPAHLYEMGLQRYDAGKAALATPFLLLLARTFPGNYRADDALGYAALAFGLSSKDGRDLLAVLGKVYPHSFFLYWLDPAAQRRPLPTVAAKPPVLPAALKKRVPAWRALLQSPFARFAKDEIFFRLDAAPADPALTRAAFEAAEAAQDFFLVTAIGERFLKGMLEAGKTGGQLPAWAWQVYYPRPFWAKVQLEARKYGLDPYWVLSIMREESHFSPTILSRSDAHGLMQILPSTGKWIAGKLGIKGRFDKNSLWNIDRNIAFGAWYLGYLRDLFNGDLFLAAAAYNGGQGNIQRKVEQGPHARLPVLDRLDRVPLPETRDYYKKVMGSWWNYHRLYD